MITNRLCTPALVLISLATIPAPAQVCPGISFITAPELLPSATGNGIGLLRESDGSYTLLEGQTFSPFRLSKQTPQIDSALTSCVPVAPYTGPAQAIPQTGAAAQIAAGAYLANGTQAIVAYTRYNRPLVNVMLIDVPNRAILFQNTYPAVTQPVSMLLADVDGDGNPDLVVADAGVGFATATSTPAGAIAILLGNGDGTFRPPTKIALTGYPASLTIADFNHDGKLDLAVGNSPANTISILLGNGDGSFRTAVNYPVPNNNKFGGGAVSLAAADVNGDGRLDLLYCDATASAGVLLGNGDGTFGKASTFPAGTNPVYVAAGDFNGDGKPDMVVTNAQTNSVSVLLGKGDGTFGKPSAYIVSYFPSNLVIADINHDGALDLVVGAGNSLGMGAGVLTVLLGNGDGTFQDAPLYSTGLQNAKSLALADFNGDGRPDAVVTDSFASSFAVLPGLGNGVFGAPVLTDTSNNQAGVRGGSLTVGDFNRDGKPDVVVAAPAFANGSGAVAFFAGKGDGTFRTPVLFPASAVSPTSVVSADFNGDGILDVIVSASPSQGSAQASLRPQLSFLAGKGDGTFGAPGSIAVTGNPTYIQAGDLNGDGKPDLVLVDSGVLGTSSAGGISIYLGNGDGTFRSPVIYPAGLNPAAVTIGDWNGDGKLDLAVATGAPNFNYALALFAGNGDGTFQPATMISTDFGPAAIAINDFNGDGIADLIVAHCCGDTDMTYLLGNGDGTFEAERHFNGPPSPDSVAVADLNGDGKPDLVIAGVGMTALINNSTPPAAGGAAPVSPQVRRRRQAAREK